MFQSLSSFILIFPDNFMWRVQSANTSTLKNPCQTLNKREFYFCYLFQCNDKEKTWNCKEFHRKSAKVFSELLYLKWVTGIQQMIQPFVGSRYDWIAFTCCRTLFPATLEKSLIRGILIIYICGISFQNHAHTISVALIRFYHM